MSQIQDNLINVKRKIEEACLRSGREPEEVRLIAVSKTKPALMVQEAYDWGQRLFGENKPQEIRDKQPVLPADIQWHMIGHLQRNKVKYVVGHAAMIHSVDSVRLAEAISEEAVRKQLTVPVLVEVNMALELSKFGLRPEDTEEFIEAIAPLEGISIKGLMTIAPYTDDPEANRVYFRDLRNLSIDIDSKNIDNVSMCELSMGMTGDYEVAVEEGATFVRVGTGIFGDR